MSLCIVCLIYQFSSKRDYWRVDVGCLVDHRGFFGCFSSFFILYAVVTLSKISLRYLLSTGVFLWNL